MLLYVFDTWSKSKKLMKSSAFYTQNLHESTRRSVNDNNPRRPKLVNEHACFLAINVFFLFIHSILTFPRFHHFRKLFGHQRANRGAIPMKI